MFSFFKKTLGTINPFRTKDNEQSLKDHISNEDEEPLKSHNSIRKPKRLPDAVKAESTKLKPQFGPLPLYRVPLKEENIRIQGCRFLKFGEQSKVAAKQSRTIMVLGATGAGKSTLINGMINYILGVKWSDSYRFVLVDDGPTKSQAHSQTSEVTVYKLHHRDGFEVPFSLTIIDTPGFGDTRGIDRDREITEQLRNLFTSKDGVSEIDAVCFVAQAALARLTPSQKYVFDSILSIFGKDIAENIRILVTFADGQKPPVLEAINASGVPSPKGEDGLPVHFKFNNSALFADNKSSAADDMSDDDENFDQMFWNMGTKSMKRFFVALTQIETKSLTLTNEVLRERKQLEVSVENLQLQVKLGLAKMEEIREMREKIKEHEAEISRNEDFEFEVTVKKPIQKDISGTGKFITNCQQCHVTCHFPCGIPNDDGKRGCWAIDSNTGYCRVCPGKCYWKVHYNQKYRWEYKDVTEKRTVADLKENYEKATGEKMTVEGLMRELEAEYGIMQNEVNKLIDKSVKCLNRLKEIALRPNPLTTPEYIEMLIEGEKQEGKPGWKQRIKSLMEVKQKAEYMAKLEKGEKPLLQESQHENTTESLQTQVKDGSAELEDSQTTDEEIEKDEAIITSNQNTDTAEYSSEVEKGEKPLQQESQHENTTESLQTQVKDGSAELEDSQTTDEEIEKDEAIITSNENTDTAEYSSEVEKGEKPLQQESQHENTTESLQTQVKDGSAELEDSQTTDEEIEKDEAIITSNQNTDTAEYSSEVEKGEKPLQQESQHENTTESLQTQVKDGSAELEDSQTTDEEIEKDEAIITSNQNTDTAEYSSEVEKGEKPLQQELLRETIIEGLQPQVKAGSVEHGE